MFNIVFAFRKHTAYGFIKRTVILITYTKLNCIDIV